MQNPARARVCVQGRNYLNLYESVRASTQTQDGLRAHVSSQV